MMFKVDFWGECDGLFNREPHIDVGLRVGDRMRVWFAPMVWLSGKKAGGREK